MVKVHGGGIQFDTQDDLGTTFTVELPDIKPKGDATPNTSS